jgi:hypothetical protein
VSALLELLNGIRRSSSLEWLTPRQRGCYETVLQRARLCSPVVLLGPAGSGKTFIAWLVRRELDLGWTAAPAELPLCASPPSGIVIDNADVGYAGARDHLAQASARRWTTAMLVARSLDTQGVPSVHLEAPTSEEIAFCLAHLPVPLSTRRLAGEGNLWRVVHHLVTDFMLGGSDDTNART